VAEVTDTSTQTPPNTNETQNNETQPIFAERVVDERAAYIMHSILKDVIKKGTGQKAKALNRSDLAGKTGTTNDQRDAWFSGFNGDTATTVWVGFDQPDTLGRREYGAAAALPIWIDYMTTALAGSPDRQMPQPEGMITVRINPETGLRSGPNDTSAIFEIFRADNAPGEATTPTSNLQNESGSTTNTPTLPEDIF
jgi:penicillin-binding protein 1A